MKKYTNIPPIITDNIYVTNFQQKANIFNDYFADQCKIHDNGSRLPEFISKTNSSISHNETTTDQIVDIIKKYNTNKAHGYDKVSVAMLQLCGTQVAVPLGIIFRKCVITGIFRTPGSTQTCSLFIRKTIAN